MFRRLAVRAVLAVAVVAAIPVAAAQAQTYNDVGATVQLSATPVAGGALTATAGGFRPNSPVRFTLFSDPVLLGTVNANAQGVASGRVTIPANTPAGAHHIEASGVSPSGAQRTVRSGTFTIATRANSRTLSRTGNSNVVPIAVTGVALVVVGVGLVFTVRRRKPASPAQAHALHP